MFYVTEPNFEFWHIPYLLYLSWMIDFMFWTLIISSHDLERTVNQLRQGWLGRIVLVYSVFSMMTLVYGWFVFLPMPLWLGASQLMPWNAALIIYAMMFGTFYLHGRILAERFFPHLNRSG